MTASLRPSIAGGRTRYSGAIWAIPINKHTPPVDEPKLCPGVYSRQCPGGRYMQCLGGVNE